MQVKYLKSTIPDFRWWSLYYSKVFPQGRPAAGASYLNILNFLERNPYIAAPVEERDLRRLLIPNTPFMIVYRIRQNRLEIVRLWDSRQKPIYGLKKAKDT